MTVTGKKKGPRSDSTDVRLDDLTSAKRGARRNVIGDVLSGPIDAAISDANLTQTAVAQLMGISQSMVSGWRRGETAPSIAQVLALDEVCGKPRGWILWRSGLVERAYLIEAVFQEWHVDVPERVATVADWPKDGPSLDLPSLDLPVDNQPAQRTPSAVLLAARSDAVEAKIYIAPTSFQDMQEVSDGFKTGATIQMDCTDTEHELKKRCVDFIIGLAHGQGGGVAQVGDVYMLRSPKAMQRPEPSTKSEPQDERVADAPDYGITNLYADVYAKVNRAKWELVQRHAWTAARAYVNEYRKNGWQLDSTAADEIALVLSRALDKSPSERPEDVRTTIDEILSTSKRSEIIVHPDDLALANELANTLDQEGVRLIDDVNATPKGGRRATALQWALQLASTMRASGTPLDYETVADFRRKLSGYVAGKTDQTKIAEVLENWKNQFSVEELDQKFSEARRLWSEQLTDAPTIG